jgi:hypothetical protein
VRTARNELNPSHCGCGRHRLKVDRIAGGMEEGKGAASKRAKGYRPLLLVLQCDKSTVPVLHFDDPCRRQKLVDQRLVAGCSEDGT